MMTFVPGNEQDAAFRALLGRLSSLAADMEAIGCGASPEDLLKGEPPFLDQWVLERRPVACLVGLSSGHPLLPGVNRSIGTSDLWLISQDRNWARTLSRWYRLGRPAGCDTFHS